MKPSIETIRRLLVGLKAEIGDDYRCDEDSAEPSMLVTIACDTSGRWNYQTGDNSFTGGAYGLPYWALVYLYRDSNCLILAREACAELADMVAEDAKWKSTI